VLRRPIEPAANTGHANNAAPWSVQRLTRRE
jgi:hypothetical protein